MPAWALPEPGSPIAIIGMLNLGSSLRFGLPEEKTGLRKTGLYRFSRNPIYAGFYLITISSMLYCANPLVIILGIYGIYVHHRVVLSEEGFLENRFGREYEEYREKVRRYL